MLIKAADLGDDVAFVYESETDTLVINLEQPWPDGPNPFIDLLMVAIASA